MKHDALILELIAEGKLKVTTEEIYVRHERDGVYRPCRPWVGTRNRDGYPKVGLKVNGKQVNIFAHRIMWVAHNGPTHLDVDHQDDDRMNYRLTNLKDMTHLENVHKSLEARYLRKQGIGPEREPEGVGVNYEVEW